MPPLSEDDVTKDDETGLLIRSPDGDVIIIQSKGPEEDCGVAVDAPEGYTVKPF